MKIHNLYLICLMLLMIPQVHAGTPPNTAIQNVLNPLFFGPAFMSITPNGTTAYVINQNPSPNSISVIDLTITPNAVTTVITDPSFSSTLFYIAFSSDSQTAYVSDTANNQVWIINVATNSVTGSVTDIGTFNKPRGIAVAPNGKKAYVANLYAGVSIIDTDPTSPSYNHVTGVVTPNGSFPFTGPISIAFTPDGTKAYVVNAAGSNSDINVVDALNDTVTGYVTPTGSFDNPGDVIITPDGTTAYVTVSNDNQVWIVNVASDTIATQQTILDPLGLIQSPRYLTTTPDGTTLYITGGAFVLANTATNTATGLVSDPYGLINGPFSAAIAPNGLLGYVTNMYANSVSILAPGLPSPPTPSSTILPPASISGCKARNIFLLQTAFANRITWISPQSGSIPIQYKIYRDPSLSNAIATVSAFGPLQYYDYYNPLVNAIYTYYITSVDSSGNQSTAISVTVTSSC